MNFMPGRPHNSQAKLVNKRKRKTVPNGEEIRGGLVIVRQPNTASSRPASQPPPDRPPSSHSHRPTNPDGSLLPPSKKFRADSQPTRASSSSKVGFSSSQPLPGLSTSKNTHIGQTPEIEEDVRAMEDEADNLRREARARALDPSLRAELPLPAARLPPQQPPPPTVKKPSTHRKSRIVDTTLDLPSAHSESPVIAKNKRLREGAMNAIRAESQEPEDDGEQRGRGRNSTVNGSGGGRGHRRASSVNGRGKRISQSFEATGILSHPHNSISESTFFKHIDPGIPETERLRLLLTWCTSRSTNSYSSASNDSGKALPALSSQEAAVLAKVQENLQQMLADKQIDISSSSQSQPSGSGQRANEQNVSNRRYEAQYTNEIRLMEQELETWKTVNHHYEAHFKKEQARLDKRKSDISRRQSLSAKAKGKQKASENAGDDDDSPSLPPLSHEEWGANPSEHALPELQHAGLALAKSILGLTISGSQSKRKHPAVRIGREEVEAELCREYNELSFNLDALHTHVNAARATTKAAEAELNRRYLLHSAAVEVRSEIPDISRVGTLSATTQTLRAYLPPRPHSSSSSSLHRTGSHDPQDLFRALAKVDSARPPGQIGEGARRAVREVQRIEESGIAGSSERRLTEVPPTPKKVPGTPRRATTPGRTTPGR